MKQGAWGRDRRQTQRPIWNARTCPRFGTGRHVSQSESGAKSPQSKIHGSHFRVPRSNFRVYPTSKLLNSHVGLKHEEDGLALKLRPPFRPIPACATGYTQPTRRPRRFVAPESNEGGSFRRKLLFGNRGRARSCLVVEGGDSAGKMPPARLEGAPSCTRLWGVARQLG